MFANTRARPGAREPDQGKGATARTRLARTLLARAWPRGEAGLAGLVLLAALPHVAAAQSDITAAQPTLPTVALTITGHDGKAHLFRVEQARSPREQEVGEMFRTAIPADGGMLFDWGTPRESQMWMRNCPVPEDMVFIGADARIHRIAENTVPQSMAIVDSEGPVRATLELQGGITEKLGIQAGDTVQGGPFAD